MKTFFLATLVSASALFAEVDRVTDYTEQHKQNVPDGCAPWLHSRFQTSHREHKGIGFDKGYTSAEFFFTPRWEKDYQPFLDLRAHVFNNGYFASNIGAGSRFISDDSKRIYGINVFFDHRGWKHLEANQFGAGFELLTRWVDFRFNGYWPFGTSYYTENFRFGGFNGNGIRVKQNIRYALPAVDLDIGGAIPLFGKYSQLELGIGSYYLFRQNAPNAHAGNAWGAKARAQFDWSKWLSIGVDWSYDRIFHGRTNGFIELRVPFGLKKRVQKMPLPKSYRTCESYRPMIRKRLMDVKRMEIIPMLEKEHDINDAIPGFFIFVNNLGQGVGAGVLPNPVGAGTFNNPYNTLAQAQSASKPGDTIYVFYGDGTTANQNSGFVMKNNQTLQGSDVGFMFSGFFVPPQTPGERPKITNTGGVGVTLADGATVRGMEIVSPTSTPVAGTSISNVTVDNCTITAIQESAGIAVTGLTGSGTFTNNIITSAGRPSSDLGGVDLRTTANTGNLDINSNTINSGFQSGVLVEWSNVNTGQTSISGNTIINGDVTYGVNVCALPMTGTYVSSNNVINCSRAGNGFAYIIDGETLTHDTFTATLENNVFQGTEAAIQLWRFIGNYLTYTINNNTFTTTSGNSYFPSLIQPISDSTITYNNNTVYSENTTDAVIFRYFTTGGTNGTLNINNNNFTSTTSTNGLSIESLGADTIQVVCKNNYALSAAQNKGINVLNNYATSPPTCCIVYTGNTAKEHNIEKINSGGTLKVKGADGTQSGIAAANSTISGGNGFVLSGTNAAQITFGTENSSCP